MIKTELEGGVVINVHHPYACNGEPCTIHNRTLHGFRGFPQVFNNQDQAMYRICPHMNFWLDPDEIKRPAVYNQPDCLCEYMLRITDTDVRAND
jgi:hypothetical protein